MGDKDETMLCSNCKRDIPSANFSMHEVHCSRHITLCDKCGEPLHQNEKEDHFSEIHALEACCKCGTEIEKSKMSGHLEKECMKRIKKCMYCEIDINFNELHTHLEYCGSRTEQCVKCHQFVMKKDELLHGSSDCMFPQPKSTNVTVPRNDYLNQDDDRLLNSFAVNDMSRLLAATNLYQEDDSFPAHLMFDTSSEIQGHRIQNNSLKKHKYKNQEVKSKANKKSDLNRRRDVAHAVNPILPSNEDGEEYDRMLAMHLANDLNSDEELDDIIRSLEKDTKGSFPSENIQNVNTDVSSDTQLPCEFCAEMFPVECLPSHQILCEDSQLQSDMGTGLHRRLNEFPREKNNRMPISPHDGLSDYPAGFDFMSSTYQRTPDDFSVEHNDIGLPVSNMSRFAEFADNLRPLPDDDSVCLPCEFCHESFPEDILIQHQSICDANKDHPESSGMPRPKLQNISLNSQNVLSNKQNEVNTKRNNSRKTSYDPRSTGLPDSLHQRNVHSDRLANIQRKNVTSTQGRLPIQNIPSRKPRVGAVSDKNVRPKQTKVMRSTVPDNHDSSSGTRAHVNRLRHEPNERDADLSSYEKLLQRKAAKDRNNLEEKNTDDRSGRAPLKPSTMIHAKNIQRHVERLSSTPNRRPKNVTSNELGLNIRPVPKNEMRSKPATRHMPPERRPCYGNDDDSDDDLTL